MFSIQGKELLNRSLNLPNVDAIYFTESDKELSDLIFVHRWCMVFPLSSSTILSRFTELQAVIARIKNNEPNPYYSSGNTCRIQSGATLLARNLEQVELCISSVLKADPESIKVLMPLRVYRNKIQDLFSWFYEMLDARHGWRQPSNYSIMAYNSLTKRPLTKLPIYYLEYETEQDSVLRTKAYIKSPVDSLWSLGTKINRRIAVESPHTVGEFGDWFIDGDKVEIYNNDLSGEIRSISPCDRCPNALKRTVGNCYFMTSQCKNLTLPNSEDKTSWKTLKSK